MLFKKCFSCSVPQNSLSHDLIILEDRVLSLVSFLCRQCQCFPLLPVTFSRLVKTILNAFAEPINKMHGSHKLHCLYETPFF